MEVRAKLIELNNNGSIFDVDASVFENTEGVKFFILVEDKYKINVGNWYDFQIKEKHLLHPDGDFEFVRVGENFSLAI